MKKTAKTIIHYSLFIIRRLIYGYFNLIYIICTVTLNAVKGIISGHIFFASLRMTRRKFQSFKDLPKKKQRFLASIMTVVTVFIGTGLIYLFNPFSAKEAAAVWFDDNWAYRKSVAITISTTAQTNYQVMLS